MATHQSHGQTHATDPIVSHGRGGERQSWPFKRSALTQFEQQVQEMFSQTELRKLKPSVAICLQARARDHIFWALRLDSHLHFRPRPAPPSFIPPRCHTDKHVPLSATRMAKLLDKDEPGTKAMAHTPLAWVWLSVIDEWLILMVRCSVAEQETLMDLWSLYREQQHRMIQMLCQNLQLGTRRTPITPGWVIFSIYLLSLLGLDESVLFPRIFPIFCHGMSRRQVCPLKNQQISLTKTIARRYRKRAQGAHRPQRTRRRIEGQDRAWKEEDLWCLSIF